MKKQFMKVLTCTVLFAAMICSSVFAAEPRVRVTLHGYDAGYTVDYPDVSKEVSVPILLFVNGDIVSDANAVIQNGTTLVPLRVVSNRLGAEVSWDSATRTVYITKGYTDIEMTIGNRNIWVNGVQQQITNAPQIIESSTYVPLRAIATAFGADIGFFNEIYDGPSATRVVYVQDRTEVVQISPEEAIEIATNIYFYDFLYSMRDYILENHNVDVYDITPDNIQYSRFGKEYFGRYFADVGHYYYIELFTGGVEFALVDKYDGTCYPVSAYSMVEFEVFAPGDYSGWGWYYQ